jgi:hypothetical protein
MEEETRGERSNQGVEIVDMQPESYLAAVIISTSADAKNSNR